MIKSYLNVFVMLVFSWSVYSVCQQDILLPAAAALVAVLSVLVRNTSSEKEFAAFEKIPLSVIIISSFFAGMFWRNIVPVPDDALSPYPEYAAALQSGSVIAALIFWLKPFTKKNMFSLIFCAWLTVGLSVNVPFTEDRLMLFSSFCFISIAVVIFNTMKSPSNGTYRFLYIRDYVFFSTLLIMLTAILFLGISTTIVSFERAFLRTMSEYIMPRQYTHFLKIRSQLNLINPGTSAFDRRPVLEVSLPKAQGVYLKLQIFENYDNGTWLEPVKILKEPLPSTLWPGHAIGNMMMFGAFQDIIPSPAGISAIKSKTSFSRSENDIVYTDNQQRTRILEFSFDRTINAVNLSQEEIARYTLVPAGVATELKDISDAMISGESDPNLKAKKMVEYFHQNFQYSLDVGFSADDKGLVRMILEKNPAYCTYFASALALLLRSQGIPSRVAAGFMTTELVNRKNNTYLARVNNAHAWTEALLPDKDPVSGRIILAWKALDATPADLSGVFRKVGFSFNLELLFEKMWFGVLRFKVWVENIDKDVLRLYLMLFLTAIMAYTNRHKIVIAVKKWLQRNRKAKKDQYQMPDTLKTIYDQYEAHIKRKYSFERALSETDDDVLVRMRKNGEIPSSDIEDIEEFIEVFQAVRFGGGSLENLEKLIEEKNFTNFSKKA